MKLGIIARSDKTGLGNQTRNLVKMLNPAKVLLIDSTPFNGNKQYPEIYAGYNVKTTNGFPSRADAAEFIAGLDAILSCETFYSDSILIMAHNKRLRTYNQFNYEFCDYLKRSPPMVTKLISPSFWHLDEMRSKFGNVVYLPPPTDENMFLEARLENFSRLGKKRFLHISGNVAVHDRNGTQAVVTAMGFVKGDCELVIKAQKPLDFAINDPRITVDYSAPENEAELYKGFDAMILPRRYGGLCLPMNEALLSALPVIMTNVSPNDNILPPEWLVNSDKTGEFMARTMIDIYSPQILELAAKMDWLCLQNGSAIKQQAYDIGYSNFSIDVLKSKWKDLII